MRSPPTRWRGGKHGTRFLHTSIKQTSPPTIEPVEMGMDSEVCFETPTIFTKRLPASGSILNGASDLVLITHKGLSEANLNSDPEHLCSLRSHSRNALFARAGKDRCRSAHSRNHRSTRQVYYQYNLNARCDTFCISTVFNLQFLFGTLNMQCQKLQYLLALQVLESIEAQLRLLSEQVTRLDAGQDSLRGEVRANFQLMQRIRVPSHSRLQTAPRGAGPRNRRPCRAAPSCQRRSAKARAARRAAGARRRG